MSKQPAKWLAVLIPSIALALGFACDQMPDGTPGGNGGGGAATPFTIVRTNIDVRHDAALRVGNDLIAFGTGAVNGVSYILPSTSPTTGTAVPNSAEYDSSAFAVGGNHIYLVGDAAGTMAFQVSVFHAPTATITRTFGTDDARLCRIPASEEDPGNIQADGTLCAVVCHQNTVTDGKMVKFIDAGANPPTVTSFDMNPATGCFNIDQVAVDAQTRTVVAVSDDTFYIYDVDNPAAVPVQIAAPNGVGAFQIRMRGNYIIAIDNQSFGEAFLVDIAAGSIMTPADAGAARQVAIGDAVFAFFADQDLDDRDGGGNRAAVGAMPGTTFAKPPTDQFIDGSTANNGLVGYGASMSVTPSGNYVFLSDGYFQYSTGDVSFTVPADPDAGDPYGCPAWDVDSSADTVGFKCGADRTQTTNTTVGYIVLP